VLVIGVASRDCARAIAAADAGADVLLLTKDTIEQSNTWYAQGGIAAVLRAGSVEAHIKDTEIVGVGLCDEEAVRTVVQEGPRRVLELLSWGAQFDSSR